MIAGDTVYGGGGAVWGDAPPVIDGDPQFVDGDLLSEGELCGDGALAPAGGDSHGFDPRMSSARAVLSSPTHETMNVAACHFMAATRSDAAVAVAASRSSAVVSRG